MQRPVSEICSDDVIAAYEVDPFMDLTFHVLVSHKLIDSGLPDYYHDEKNMELFGFPFMASFSAELTCRQIWDYLWVKIKKNRLQSTFFGAVVECMSSCNERIKYLMPLPTSLN